MIFNQFSRMAMMGTLITATLALSSAARAAENYETVLGPAPLTDATKFKVTGRGAAVAVLDGQTLTITGQFSGLSSPATDAHLMLGSGIGIPGSPMTDISVTATAEGKVTGSVKLSRDQAAALRAGRIYIQINSQIAPAPGGNLWGWLLPEHEKVGQDEPQTGHWYLPQGEGLKAHPAQKGPTSNRNS
jgi:hypothetical protein